MRFQTVKRSVLLVFGLLLLLSVTVWASEEDPGIGWYFKKNDTHTLPPLDAGLSYITQYDGYYADTAVKKEDPVIYLTFDAGYENGNIARILDTLKKHDAQGAFFILENLILRDAELVRRMKDEGHLICNHTAKHKDMTTLSASEIEKELTALSELYEEKIGGEMAPFFRPPEGKFNKKSLETVQKLGYTTVFWSLAYADWDNNKQPSHESAKKILCDNIHNGAILLLHPTSKTNADILDELLTKWKAEGYRFGSLTELTKECP